MAMSVVKQAEASLNEGLRSSHIQHKDVYYIGSGLWMAANLAQASAPLMVAYSRNDARDGRFEPTQYQTADARHSRIQAARLIRRYVGGQA